MTIGERIAPTTVTVTIVTVIHMLPTMCGAPPKTFSYPFPTALLFAFIAVVQIIGRWSAATVLETTERKVAYPVQHPVGTPETNNVHLPQHLAKFRKNPMLGPEIMTNLGLLVTTHRDPQQADNTSNNHNAPHRANQIIKIVFPYRDYRYSDQPRRTRFNKNQNQIYSPYHFAPSPALSAGSDLLSPLYHAACRNTITFA